MLKLLPVSLFTEILKADNLGHFTQVDGTQVCVGALLVAYVQQVTECVVALLGGVPRHLLVATQLLLQQAKHYLLIWDVHTKTITQSPK